MNQSICLCFCCLLFFSVEAPCQTDTLTTFHDADWNKVSDSSKAEYIRKAYVHDIGFWKITDYYKSGQVYMTGTFFDKDVQEPVGLLEWFYLSGGLKARQSYLKGRLVGESFSYYENGQLDTYRLLDNSGQIEEARYYKEDGTDSVVEHPEFPGGIDAMYRFLSEHAKYPRSLRTRGVIGEVFAKFFVDTDGSLQDISIFKSPHEKLSKEAMKVIMSMPIWKPGSRDGELLRVGYNLPIRFVLE